MSIPIQRPSQKQVFDHDFWAVFLGIGAMFFFFLTLVLAKSPTHTSGLDVFAGRGLRISSVSALVTALVALFRFRHSRVLAILALLASAPLVWLYVLVPLFTT